MTDVGEMWWSDNTARCYSIESIFDVPKTSGKSVLMLWGSAVHVRLNGLEWLGLTVGRLLPLQLYNREQVPYDH